MSAGSTGCCPACGRALEASQPVSRTARAESAAAPRAGLQSAAQYEKITRELVEQLLAEADELEATAEQSSKQHFFVLLKSSQHDLQTMRAQGGLGAAPAVLAVECVPRDDGLLNTMVRQKPFFDLGCGSSNARVAATKQRRSKGTEIERRAEPFVVKEGSKQPRPLLSLQQSVKGGSG